MLRAQLRLCLIEEKTCQAHMLSKSAPRCSAGIQIGTWCEGDGECGTRAHLNNCPGGFDVYRRVPATCIDKHSTCPALKRMFDGAGFDCYTTDVGAVTNSSSNVGIHLVDQCCKSCHEIISTRQPTNSSRAALFQGSLNKCMGRPPTTAPTSGPTSSTMLASAAVTPTGSTYES